MTGNRRINVSGAERTGRVLVGAVLAVVGALILSGGPGFWGVIGAVLLVAAGLDFVVTGATGYCPLYARLGHVPRSLQQRS